MRGAWKNEVLGIGGAGDGGVIVIEMDHGNLHSPDLAGQVTERTGRAWRTCTMRKDGVGRGGWPKVRRSWADDQAGKDADSVCAARVRMEDGAGEETQEDRAR